MTEAAAPAPARSDTRPREFTRLGPIVTLLAIACGLAVANLYYAQPLLGPLSRTFHTSTGSISNAITVTQIGYAAGLVFLVPLGDLLENRRLATRILVATAVALVLCATAPNLSVFIVASLAVGATSVVAQVLIPLAAHLAPEEQRGRVVGQVMSGLLVGILLARTVSSLLAAALGWRWVYGISAALMLLLAATLARRLPERQPEPGPRYGALLASLVELARTQPMLRRRAAYQTLMFGTFSLFWSTVADELTHTHHLSQTEIGIFALVGAAGALAAPIAGRLGDRGHGQLVTGTAFGIATGAMLLAGLGHHNLVLLALGGIGLDLAVQANMVVGQREIYALAPTARSRLNSVYIGTFFLGGAAGSALSGALYSAHGWRTVALCGAIFPALGLAAWSARLWADRHGTHPH